MKDIENKAEKVALKGKDIPNLSPFSWEDPFLIEDQLFYVLSETDILLYFF